MMLAITSRLSQAGETIRQLHQRLVENVGSEQAAKAIEGVSVVFVILIVFIFLRGRWSSHARRRKASQKRFKELARVHRLGSADKQVLLSMARHLELEEPGLIFVRRSLFESAAETGKFKEERVDVLRRELYT